MLENFNYLFSNRTSRSNCASIISSGTRISFRYFLTIFSPLASIIDLQSNSNLAFSEKLSNNVWTIGELTVAAWHLVLTDTLAFLFGGKATWLGCPENWSLCSTFFCNNGKLAMTSLLSFLSSSLSICNLKDNPNSVLILLEKSSLDDADGGLSFFVSKIWAAPFGSWKAFSLPLSERKACEIS